MFLRLGQRLKKMILLIIIKKLDLLLIFIYVIRHFNRLNDKNVFILTRNEINLKTAFVLQD
jgi:hypothetical protein